MPTNAEILLQLINEDFGVDTRDGSRWAKSVDHDSLVVDKEKGVFFWNSEDIKGNPFTYLTNVRGMKPENAKDLLRQLRSSSVIPFVEVNQKQQQYTVYPELVEAFYEEGKLDGRRDYFYRRGLSDKTIDRFQLGWHEGWVTIPFFEDGKFRNFQLRQDKPEKRMKGFYSKVGPLLFNDSMLKLVSTIYITEGPVDAMALIQNGLPAVSTNCGGVIHSFWSGKFASIKNVFLLFDNDSAGMHEAKRTANILGEERCKIYNFWDFNTKGYDPVDFFKDGHTTTELLQLVNTGCKYAFQL